MARIYGLADASAANAEFVPALGSIDPTRLVHPVENLVGLGGMCGRCAERDGPFGGFGEGPSLVG